MHCVYFIQVCKSYFFYDILLIYVMCILMIVCRSSRGSRKNLPYVFSLQWLVIIINYYYYYYY